MTQTIAVLAGRQGDTTGACGVKAVGIQLTASEKRGDGLT